MSNIKITDYYIVYLFQHYHVFCVLSLKKFIGIKFLIND